MEKFEDKNIELQLSMFLNKKYEDIEANDLEKVKIIVLDNQCIENHEYVRIIEILPKLEEISIYGATVNDDLLKLIAHKVNKISMEQCIIDESSSLIDLKNLKSLYLRNCFISDYNKLFLNLNVDVLQIQKANGDNSIDLLNIPKNIKILVLNKCKLKNCKFLGNLNECNTLSILETDVDQVDLTFLEGMQSIKNLYISSNYSQKKIVKELSEKINVYFDMNHLLFDKEYEDETNNEENHLNI